MLSSCSRLAILHAVRIHEAAGLMVRSLFEGSLRQSGEMV